MEFKVNLIMITGNVAKIQELQMTKTKSKLVVNFTIAKNLTKENTMFIDIRAWNDASDNITSLNVGDKVFIQGKLGQDKEGKFVIDINRKSDIQIVHSKFFDDVGYTPDKMQKLAAQAETKEIINKEKKS